MSPSQNTSIRQDVALVNAMLALCASRKVAGSVLPRLLTATHGHLLDGHPIASDPGTYDEKLRERNFMRYCENVRDFIVAIRLGRFVRERAQSGAGPMEVQCLRVTRLGRLYAGLPPWLQSTIVGCLSRLIWIARYKWLGITVGAVTAAIGWFRMHEMSGRLVGLAVLVGVAAMLIADRLRGEETASDSPSPDETLW
jgi:hypothetical protein